jgi:hypothetical protein
VIGVSIADPQVIEISRLFVGLNGYWRRRLGSG